MATFEYRQSGSSPLSHTDIYRLFNHYRLWKYVMGILIRLNKTSLSEYRVLEPGCGGGEKLRFLTEFRVRPENCFGFDISEEAIGICRALSPASMNFETGSIFEMPYPDHFFDLIICSGFFDCFDHDDDIRKISRNLDRVLKGDGVVFVVDINEHFKTVYGKSEAVMNKNLRSFDTRTGELEKLVSTEFDVFSRLYIFAADQYTIDSEGSAADLVHLPIIDHQIDRQQGTCAYTLWAFLKRARH